MSPVLPAAPVLPASPVLPVAVEPPVSEPLLSPVLPESGGVVVVSLPPGPVVLAPLPDPPEPAELPDPAPGLVSLAGGVVFAGWVAGV